MPGTNIREAVRVVLGELPGLPHLPELPARGVGADLTGRTLGLLVDLHAEVQPSGWRVAAAAGRDERRAMALLGEDLDALEELAEGWTGHLKLQVAGPWTMAATLELRYGNKALADEGACRDLTDSLAEGVAEHVRQVARRLPKARLLVQLDEPALPGVLAGSVPTASGFSRLAAVDPERAVSGLRAVLGVLPEDVLGIVHSCAPEFPFDVVRRAGAGALSFDVSLFKEVQEEALGTAVEAGTRLLLGVIDATSHHAESPGDLRPPVASDLDASLAPVRELWHRLGLPAETLRDVVLPPTCGLSGASPARARWVLAAATGAGRRLAEDPEGDLSKGSR